MGQVSRRTFLKQVGVGASAAAAASLTGCEGAGEVNKPGEGPRYGMVIDLRRCFGCHACTVACKAEQEDVPLGYWKSWVIQTERNSYPHVRRLMLPVLCNHCQDPPCVPVCPTGATYQRPDGTVVVEEQHCIGCKYCILACPYNVRYLHPQARVAKKCDFCIHRVEQGLLPACVNTCNARARIFGDLNDPTSWVSRVLAQNPVQVLQPERGTDPRVFYVDLDRSAYPGTFPMRKHN